MKVMAIGSGICILMAFLPMGRAQTRPSRGSEACAAKHAAGIHVSPLSASRNGAAHAYDVLKYALVLDIYHCYLPPYPRTFSTFERITLLADSTISSVSLDADSASLAVDSISLSATGFIQSGNILMVGLNRPYVSGDTVTIGIYYRHKEVVDHSFYVGTDGLVFTDCEPEGARKWFPCWDNPSDKALWELTTVVPSSVKLGSNGSLVDSTTRNDTTTFHWVSRDPIATYLMVLTSKAGYNLDVIEWPRMTIPTESIPVRFYWNNGETNLENVESALLPMMSRYSQLFGEYPFEKAGFATLDTSFPWGGMENQTLISLCPDCWDVGLVSHEFAHQWFGDMITCGTWADIWLNEGFATYCEALWIESRSGPAAYDSTIAHDAAYYIGTNPGWAIYNPAWAIVTPTDDILFNYAITYIKGSCVLHMLRYVLGDTLFFSAMKSYATDPALKYRSAVTTDFISDISNAAGQDLSWFFNEWVYQPNDPAYANTYTIDSVGGNMWEVTFRASQTQPDPTFFRMPIELNVSFVTGPDSLIRVWNDINSQVFTFDFSRRPTAVQFDPRNGIALKTGGITGVTELGGVPREFRLEQNYPNPFNPATVITFQVPVAANVKIEVYDILGREVALLLNERKNPGTYGVEFNASGLASGVYLYRFASGSFVETRKMLLVR